jgi:hypothetical protein
MRLVLTLLVLSLLLAGLFWLLPVISAQADRPWLLLGSWIRDWDQIAEKRLALERIDAIVLWRNQAKRQVIVELLAERLTLLEAAAWFDRITREMGSVPYSINPTLIGMSFQEHACRQVIRWVDSEFSLAAESLRKQWVEQLEEELEQLLTSPGDLVLPEPPPLATPLPETTLLHPC